MMLSIDLSKFSLITDCISHSIAKVNELSYEAGYSKPPIGFYIDNAYCDWYDISVTKIVDIIDATCSVFGSVSCKNYQVVCDYICESVTAHFSKPEDTLIIRKIYNDGEFLDYRVNKTIWDDLMADYDDAETTITELLALNKACKLDQLCEPDFKIKIENYGG